MAGMMAFVIIGQSIIVSIFIMGMRYAPAGA